MADEIKNEDTNEVLPTAEKVSGESLIETEDKEQEAVTSFPDEEAFETPAEEEAEEEAKESFKEVDPDAEYDYHKRG